MVREIVEALKIQIIPMVLLFVFWMVLSPQATQQSILLGLLASILVTWYSGDILYTTAEMPLYRLRVLGNMIGYFFVLSLQIVKANLYVVRVVLSPRLHIQPQFVRVPMMLENDINKLIYANSVTLTPGTLTVDVKEDHFLIHALTDEEANSLQDSFVEQWVTRQEGR